MIYIFLIIAFMRPERAAFELADAYKSLGITPTEVSLIDGSDPTKALDIDFSVSINLFLGVKDPESLTLAKAVIEGIRVSESLDGFNKQFHIIMSDKDTRYFYLFDGKKFDKSNAPGVFDYTLHPDHGEALLKGDMDGYYECAENKYRTGEILKKNGIFVPKELVFHSEDNVTGNNQNILTKIDELFINSDKIVLKPSTGGCGQGIFMLSREDIDADFYQTYIKGQDTILLQEKIQSFPMENKKKDWNLRVLVTFDQDTQKYKYVGMIGRIDDDGKPVNISLTAEYISFDDIAKSTGWSNELKSQIEHDIIDISVQSVSAIAFEVAGEQDLFESLIHHQDISGVDIIINPEGKPVVIEVNSASSCGVYQLMKYEKIKSILPIVDSILIKLVALEIEHQIYQESLK